MTAQAVFEQAKALHRAGRIGEAKVLYARLLDDRPDWAEVQNALGIALQQQGRLEEAVLCYRAALTAKPDYAAAESNLGAAMQRLGRMDEAEAHYRRAIALDSGQVDALYNLACALHDQDRLDEAVALYRRVLAARTGHVDALNNLGIALRDQGRAEEAVGMYRQALALAPRHAESHYNLAMALLETGDWAAGWDEYEWRFAARDVGALPFREPRWRGEPLDGRVVLVWAEQGHGDSLNFARYVPVLARQAKSVLVMVQPPLERLFQSLAGADRILVPGDPLPPFDVQCPLLSLPGPLGTRVESVAADIPYLAPPPEALSVWTARLPAGSRRRIALAWAGNSKQRNDRHRSLPSEQAARLARFAGADVFSVQVGVPLAALGPEAGAVVTDLAPDLTDFAETAAALTRFDLVVSVDTAVAHLAGAMGLPVWTLLAFVPDWRWLRGREDSPWYPTMRLFRQTAPGDWASVVDRVLAALGDYF